MPTLLDTYQTQILRLALLSDKRIFAKKRHIEILPSHGCSIRLANCPVWATTVAHDLTNTEIMILLPERLNVTITCEGGKPEQAELPIRGIISLDLGCSLHASSFHIDQITFRHMASEKSNVDSKVNFKIVEDVNQIAGKLNLQIHDFTDVNRPDIDNLMRNNKDIKEEIRDQRSRSQSLWSKVSGGSSPIQQIIVWAILAALILTAITMLICHIKLRLKIRRTGKTKEEEEFADGQIRDMKSRIIEVEAELQALKAKSKTR